MARNAEQRQRLATLSNAQQRSATLSTATAGISGVRRGRGKKAQLCSGNGQHSNGSAKQGEGKAKRQDASLSIARAWLAGRGFAKA